MKNATHLTISAPGDDTPQESSWQAVTTEALTSLLRPDPDVLALVIFGSAAHGRPDQWSDLDGLLVVRPQGRGRFTDNPLWLAPLGAVYAAEQSAHAYASITRVCLTDMRRLDILVTTERGLEHACDWPSVPFWNEAARRVIFSRSPSVDAVLSRPLPPPTFTPAAGDDVARLADGFWFKGALAVTKVMRDDRLIALHLTLEMMQDCAVLGMMLRDRAEGTRHHKTGGLGNSVAETLGAIGVSGTPEGILHAIEHCAVEFDHLAAQWSPVDQERRHPLLAWIAKARQTQA